MEKLTAKLALLTASFLFFGASSLSATQHGGSPPIQPGGRSAGMLGGKAGEPFNLNSFSAKDIENSIQADQKGILDWIKPNEPAKPAAAKEWTVMVFMNAKNDLANSALFGLSGKWAVKDLAEMKKVGTTDKVNVVVEYGTAGKGAKRMLVGKSSLFSSGETVYSQDPNADMGDYKRVIEFAKWAKTNFPAKKYMFVLWNHGLGWIDPNLQQHSAGTGTNGNKGILFDDETKNYVRTKQLGDILRASGYMDVFVMNACLMQMAEVNYEVKDNTGLIVASEETMLAYGFDYEKLLNFMNAEPGATDERISDFFINWQKQFFSEGAPIGPIHMPLSSIAATMSTVKPQALNELPRYLNAFAGAAMANNETGAVKIAIEKAVRFSSLDPKKDKKKMLAPYVDLYDFARITGENAASQATKQAAEELMGFIKSRLVLRSVGLNADAENGYDYTKAGGIAITMTMKIKNPPPQLADIYETKYSDLSLSQASQWDEFTAWTDKVWQSQ
ncbi:MAG: hypothetical protein KKH28_03885 [Elusimicrobia bacterium]|nr:hypothetical protein [Elusimicrobiota bacterium]